MIEVGPFVILGDWDPAVAPAGRIEIRMPPLGHVYGAGWLPHTQSALLGIATHVRPGMSFWELGAGSCILSIAAEKLGASPCYATEINPEALEAGQRVLKANASNVHLIDGTFIDEECDIVIVSISSQFILDHRPLIKGKRIFNVEDDGSLREV